MSEIDEMVTWLRAQLDEDEQGARALAGREFSAYVEGGADGWAIESADGDLSATIGDEALAQHIARHDPARVLRDVAAKLAIVAEVSSAPPIAWANVESAQVFAAVLRHLAAGYDDRPGYLEAWRP